MNPIDYSILYKRRYDSLEELTSINYDLFLSVFNDSERVKRVYDKVPASKKHWLILPEYNYDSDEYPSEQSLYVPDEYTSESDVILDFLNWVNVDYHSDSICIDITGFVRPHLIFLIRYLMTTEISKVDFLYTDPIRYVKKENTEFSDNYVAVRQIAGCEGKHNPETNNDFLIIGSGYDNQRITDVAKNKADTKKVQLFGFPSLQPDMYQENIMRAYRAEEASADGRQKFIDPDYTLFAPANDPFITASLLQNFVKKEEQRKNITNLYLSPLSTKAQTLGFALFYIAECLNKPVSIIFPICEHYSKETTEGIAKIWRYTVDFDYLR